jgi:hypothetical protein
MYSPFYDTPYAVIPRCAEVDFLLSFGRIYRAPFCMQEFQFSTMFRMIISTVYEFSSRKLLCHVFQRASWFVLSAITELTFVHLNQSIHHPGGMEFEFWSRSKVYNREHNSLWPLQSQRNLWSQKVHYSEKSNQSGCFNGIMCEKSKCHAICWW